LIDQLGSGEYLTCTGRSMCWTPSTNNSYTITRIQHITFVNVITDCAVGGVVSVRVDGEGYELNSAEFNAPSDTRTIPTQYKSFPVLGKITCEMIWNQNQNHTTKKWFKIKIKIKIMSLVL